MATCEKCGTEITLEHVINYQHKCPPCYYEQFQGQIEADILTPSVATSLFRTRLGTPGRNIISDKGDDVLANVDLILGESERVWFGTVNYTTQLESLIFCATYFQERIFIVRKNEVLKIIEPNRIEEKT